MFWWTWTKRVVAAVFAIIGQIGYLSDRGKIGRACAAMEMSRSAPCGMEAP